MSLIFHPVFQRISLFLISLAILQSCSCGNSKSGVFRIGVDPSWYPLDFGPQQPFVNGFTDEVLLEIARYTGIEFEKMNANWDSLYNGVWEKKYDGILSSLPPYEFNRANFDFSRNFLQLGPVLIVPVADKHQDLSQLHGELVGLVAGDPAVLILQKYPEIVLRNYPSIPDLLNAIADGEVEAGLLDRIPAVNYIQDLYAGRLKIASVPLTDAGLHLLVPKGKDAHLLRQFDKALERMEKKKQLHTLLQKWKLG